jgi:hypothetical protein
MSEPCPGNHTCCNRDEFSRGVFPCSEARQEAVKVSTARIAELEAERDRLAHNARVALRREDPEEKLCDPVFSMAALFTGSKAEAKRLSAALTTMTAERDRLQRDYDTLVDKITEAEITLDQRDKAEAERDAAVKLLRELETVLIRGYRAKVAAFLTQHPETPSPTSSPAHSSGSSPQS